MFKKEDLIDSENYPKEREAFDWLALAQNVFYFLLGILFAALVSKIKKISKAKPPKPKKFRNIADMLSFLVQSGHYEELIAEIETDIKAKKVKKIAHYAAQMSKKDRH
jgi:hypothetical protein